MEDDSNISVPNETHPLLPLQAEASSNSTEDRIVSEETSVQDTLAGPHSSANPTSDEDVTDDCCTRSTPPCADDSGVISNEPKSDGGPSEYKAIFDMLKEAEKSAEDPEYEEKAMARKFGAIKYNPRNPESSFGAVDYLCAFFQCCAVCIEG